MAKDTNFKFGTPAPSKVPTWPLKKIWKRGRGQRHVMPYLAEICTLMSTF